MQTMRAICAPTYRPETNPRILSQNSYNNLLQIYSLLRTSPITLSMASYGGGGGVTDDDGVKSFKISSSSSLKIQRGDITKWSVNGTSDAIVNTANEQMLGGMGVDGAIHRAAGPELRAACYTVPEVSRGIPCPKGEARITRAFQLAVSNVIHTIGPVYNVDNHPEVILRNAYRNCLKLAKENNIEYIAFPAISCGIYGYPYEKAATIAISTVMESDGDFKE
ncbi:hypothetical protein MKW94_024980, partial [Papaver nudicaule]|nr:hypothetical protein [Papaver nudicaule]